MMDGTLDMFEVRRAVIRVDKERLVELRGGNYVLESYSRR